MPVLHYTQHTYGSWLPDKYQGFVHWKTGLQDADKSARTPVPSKLKHDVVQLTHVTQKLIIQTLIDAQLPLKLTLHSIATDAHPSSCHRRLAGRTKTPTGVSQPANITRLRLEPTAR